MLHPQRAHHQESHGPFFFFQKGGKDENKNKILILQNIWYPQEIALSL